MRRVLHLGTAPALLPSVLEPQLVMDGAQVQRSDLVGPCERILIPRREDIVKTDYSDSIFTSTDLPLGVLQNV